MQSLPVLPISRALQSRPSKASELCLCQGSCNSLSLPVLCNYSLNCYSVYILFSQVYIFERNSLDSIGAKKVLRSSSMKQLLSDFSSALESTLLNSSPNCSGEKQSPNSFDDPFPRALHPHRSDIRRPWYPSIYTDLIPVFLAKCPLKESHLSTLWVFQVLFLQIKDQEQVTKW